MPATARSGVGPSATSANGRFLLTMQLRRLEAAEQDIDALDMRIAERLEPSGVQHALLMKIPGVDWLVAAVLIAEIGVDMSGSSAPIIWRHGRVCVRVTTRARASRRADVPAKATFTSAPFWPVQPPPPAAPREVTSKIGTTASRRAAAPCVPLAIAHKILVVAYHILAKGLAYHDLGEAYLDQISQTRTASNLKRRLERLGYIVTRQPKEPPSLTRLFSEQQFGLPLAAVKRFIIAGIAS